MAEFVRHWPKLGRNWPVSPKVVDIELELAKPFQTRPISRQNWTPELESIAQKGRLQAKLRPIHLSRVFPSQTRILIHIKLCRRHPEARECKPAVGTFSATSAAKFGPHPVVAQTRLSSEPSRERQWVSGASALEDALWAEDAQK